MNPSLKGQFSLPFDTVQVGVSDNFYRMYKVSLRPADHTDSNHLFFLFLCQGLILHILLVRHYLRQTHFPY